MCHCACKSPALGRGLQPRTQAAARCCPCPGVLQAAIPQERNCTVWPITGKTKLYLEIRAKIFVDLRRNRLLVFCSYHCLEIIIIPSRQKKKSYDVPALRSCRGWHKMVCALLVSVKHRPHRKKQAAEQEACLAHVPVHPVLETYSNLFCSSERSEILVLPLIKDFLTKHAWMSASAPFLFTESSLG